MRRNRILGCHMLAGWKHKSSLETIDDVQQLSDEALIEIWLSQGILPTPSASHVSVRVCFWHRRCFLTSVHLLPYWNQHLRHVCTQDGEVGREITLIASLFLPCLCDICFCSSKWVFSVLSVCGAGFIEALTRQGIHNFSVYIFHCSDIFFKERCHSPKPFSVLL